MTPDEIRELIVGVRLELRRAPDVLQELELVAERADLAADTVFHKAFLSADGAVDVRRSVAKLAAGELYSDAVVARAGFNRARLKVRLLEAELMSLQALLKSVQAEL